MPQCTKDAVRLFLQLPLSINKHNPDLFIRPTAGRLPYVAAKLLGKFAAVHFPPATKFTPTLLRKHYMSLTDEQDQEVKALHNRAEGHSKEVAEKVCV
eukprot:6044222-Amphidinium_carterae.1